MRSNPLIRRATRAACLAAALAPALTVTRGATAADDAPQPSRLGRLFRFGAASEPSKPGPAAPAVIGAPTGGSMTSGPASTSMGLGRMGMNYPGQPALSTPPTGMDGPGGAGLTPTPRISPKPRTTKAVTEADPLVTRISLGRADGGSQFGMFLQVFADGTVVDGGGVHKISPEALKPVVEAVGGGDFAKIKGHCGGPAGDTFENVHVVTYERAYGKLRANAFSYSGNPQGCDHAVHHLHKVLEDLQLKLDAPAGGGGMAASASTTPVVVNPPMTGPAPAAGPALAPAAAAPALPPMSGPLGAAMPAPLGMPSLPDPGLH